MLAKRYRAYGRALLFLGTESPIQEIVLVLCQGLKVMENGQPLMEVTFLCNARQVLVFRGLCFAAALTLPCR